MTVERMPGAGREPLLFIVCDKLEDMAAVPVRAEALERWQVTEATLADALARLLGSSEATAWPGEALRLRLGMVEGRRRKDVAYLSWQTNGPMLMVAGHALELAQVLSIKAGRLVLDAGELRRCVDAPADGAEPPESPGERRRRFLEIVTKARKRNPRAFLQAAADSAGVSVDVLKQVIYRKPKPKPAGAIATVAGILSSPISPRARRTR